MPPHIPKIGISFFIAAVRISFSNIVRFSFNFVSLWVVVAPYNSGAISKFPPVKIKPSIMLIYLSTGIHVLVEIDR